MTTTIANPYPNVPIPADAVSVGAWEDTEPGVLVERHFWATDRDGVQIHGFQQPSGRVTERYVSLDFDPGSMGVSEARELGRRLIAAADELDALSAGAESEVNR